MDLKNMDAQATASCLAEAFNKKSPTGTESIKFLEVSVVHWIKEDASEQYFNAEELLPNYKNYRKWTSNIGYLNPEDSSETLEAFSHWTYVFTERYLQVVDLQGVKNGDSYILTDPSIHCKLNSNHFGRTDLGQEGMRIFFEAHVCGDICRKMNLNIKVEE